MKLSKIQKKLYRHQLEQMLKEAHNPQDVLGFLFDDDQFSIIDRYADVDKLTKLQRFNRLWVYPLFILAAPFRYVMYGDPGYDRESRLGRVLERLVGYY